MLFLDASWDHHQIRRFTVFAEFCKGIFAGNIINIWMSTVRVINLHVGFTVHEVISSWEGRNHFKAENI